MTDREKEFEKCIRNNWLVIRIALVVLFVELVAIITVAIV
jgi:hypothetical protein